MSSRDNAVDIRWGAKTLADRGVLITKDSLSYKSNTIGVHANNHSVYRGLAVATKQLPKGFSSREIPLNDKIKIQPNQNWFDPDKIVSLDPWGMCDDETALEHIEKGAAVNPTISSSPCNISIPELKSAIDNGDIAIDGKIVAYDKSINGIKLSCDNVWHLPGVAKRIGVSEEDLRASLYHETGGMYEELLTCYDKKIFIPPIGGVSIYIFGQIENIAKGGKLTLRVHDECNGSDVFSSNKCTCRPYLMFALQECVSTAQSGGVGIIMYFRKEGRALGEVNKLLIYNRRNLLGDTEYNYFSSSKDINGLTDARFHELCVDFLHWLGIKTIDKFVSMSDQKYSAIINAGINIKNRIELPGTKIPSESYPEIKAKIMSGYFSDKLKDFLSI